MVHGAPRPHSGCLGPGLGNAAPAPQRPVARGAAAGPRGDRRSSSIRTLPSAPDSHRTRALRLAGSTRVRHHRRWGLAPRPEDHAIHTIKAPALSTAHRPRAPAGGGTRRHEGGEQQGVGVGMRAGLLVRNRRMARARGAVRPHWSGGTIQRTRRDHEPWIGAPRVPPRAYGAAPMADTVVAPGASSSRGSRPRADATSEPEEPAALTALPQRARLAHAADRRTEHSRWADASP